MDASSKYTAAINEWLASNTPDRLTAKVLSRGLWCCIADPVGVDVLITGINPSYDSTTNPADARFADCSGRHWNPIKKIVAPLLECVPPKAAYLDLFPLRATKQAREFEKLPLTLKAIVLSVTQQEIERLRPKLIVHLNNSSAFYWGTAPNHPWMGYDLKPIEDYSGKGKLYRIVGMQQNEDRILRLDATNLTGSYLLIYRSNRFLKTELQLNYSDIANIIRLQ